MSCICGAKTDEPPTKSTAAVYTARIWPAAPVPLRALESRVYTGPDKKLYEAPTDLRREGRRGGVAHRSPPRDRPRTVEPAGQPRGAEGRRRDAKPGMKVQGVRYTLAETRTVEGRPLKPRTNSALRETAR